MRSGVLISFHCSSEAGYAIGRLESVFHRMATSLAGAGGKVFIAYTSLSGEAATKHASGHSDVLCFDALTRDRSQLEDIQSFVRTNSIGVVMLFDKHPGLPVYRALRTGGVKTIISYWGAPMSSPQSTIRLMLKRLQVLLIGGPDLYVFESEAMRLTATHGRGIPARKTVVVPLGVDPLEFRPSTSPSTYTHDAFRIPREAHVVLYSGHMEPRKGVAVIVRAAVRLAESGRRDIYFLMLGDRPGESDQYADLYSGTAARDLIIFGGYRNDVAELMRGATVGVIASTGWDSFTRSAVEMAASGLPLVVSRLQGLVETVEEGVTGRMFEPGNHEQLAYILANIVDDSEGRKELAAAARTRILKNFTEERQIEQLIAAVRTCALHK